MSIEQLWFEAGKVIDARYPDKSFAVRQKMILALIKGVINKGAVD